MQSERLEKFHPYCIAYGASASCMSMSMHTCAAFQRYLQTFHSSSNRFFSLLRALFFLKNRSYAILTTFSSISLSFPPTRFLASLLALLPIHFLHPGNMIYELCVRPFHLLWLWSTVSNSVSFDGISILCLCVALCGCRCFALKCHLRSTASRWNIRFVLMFQAKKK